MSLDVLSDSQLNEWAWREVLRNEGEAPDACRWNPCENLTDTFGVFAETDSQLVVATHDTQTGFRWVRRLVVRFEAADDPIYLGAFGSSAARAAMEALYKRLDADRLASTDGEEA